MIEITPEMIEALPEDQRGPWLEQIERQKQRENFIQKAIDEMDWHNALVMCESQERAPVLIEAGKSMKTKRELRKLLKKWWSITEAWSGNPEWRRDMYALIRRAAPLYVPGYREGKPEFQGKLIVYRGNLGDDPGYGESWTLDRKTAEKFASMGKSVRGMFLGMYREDGWPTVWRGVVDAEDVLAYFNDRGEQEIISDRVYAVDKIAEAQR